MKRLVVRDKHCCNNGNCDACPLRLTCGCAAREHPNHLIENLNQDKGCVFMGQIVLTEIHIGHDLTAFNQHRDI